MEMYFVCFLGIAFYGAILLIMTIAEIYISTNELIKSSEYQSVLTEIDSSKINYPRSTFKIEAASYICSRHIAFNISKVITMSITAPFLSFFIPLLYGLTLRSANNFELLLLENKKEDLLNTCHRLI